jgi:alpha-ketoglutarate-dependent taurine dioxygenase
MHKAVTTDQLVAAANAVTLTFCGVPPDPVPLDRISAPRPHLIDQVVSRYERYGFAIIELARDDVSAEALISIADALDMGQPFLPPLYSRTGASGPVVTRISAALNHGTPDADHPSFGRTSGQNLHCDGTLQPIGFIKASMLLCESPAADGGDTTLFNASAAYAKLVREDLPAAIALASPGVLVRRANINGSDDANIGPAFTVHDEQLVCGYSETETDSWALPDSVAEQELQRGVEYLRRVSGGSSEFYLERTLGAGQVILLDNTRISHGRTPYQDSPSQRRCLYRSLHLAHPRSALTGT